jgi:hypothetical protein
MGRDEAVPNDFDRSIERVASAREWRLKSVGHRLLPKLGSAAKAAPNTKCVGQVGRALSFQAIATALNRQPRLVAGSGQMVGARRIKPLPFNKRCGRAALQPRSGA